MSVQVIVDWTGIRQELDSDWTDLVADPPLDRHWALLGQGLDKGWISRPTFVQPTIDGEYRRAGEGARGGAATNAPRRPPCCRTHRTRPADGRART